MPEEAGDQKRLKVGDEVITVAMGFPTTVNPIITVNPVISPTFQQTTQNTLTNTLNSTITNNPVFVNSHGESEEAHR